MNKIALFLLLTFFMYSCFNSNPLTIDSQELKLTLPKGWFVKELINEDEQSEVIVFQNGKFIPKGVITISIFNQQSDLYQMIDIYQNLLLNDEGIIQTKATFEQVSIDDFASFETLSCNYSMEVLSTSSKGVMHAFHHKNKTIMNLLQGVPDNDVIIETAKAELESTLEFK